MRQGQTTIPHIISISFIEIATKHGNTSIALTLGDISDLMAIGFSKMLNFYQTPLTNAISHERLTPLNTIINCCETVRKELLATIMDPFEPGSG